MNALLTTLGWMWLVAAVVTTAVAFALAGWMAWRPTASVDVQHRTAAGGLVLSLVAVALVPYVLAPRNVVVRATNGHVEAATVSGPAATAVSRRAGERLVSRSFASVAWGAGLMVLAAASVMLVRLAGGWWMVTRLVRRSRPLHSASIVGAVARLQRAMSVRIPLEIRVSSEVGVPLVVGCRPVLILPEHLIAAVPAETWSPLLGHEIAHAARRDYLANLVQSACDVLLVTCPGAWWISRRVRETREYCCDQSAVEACGDRRRYAESLASIAELSIARAPALALGVGGPRLAVRVARLLNPDRPKPDGPVRVAAFTAAAVVFCGAAEQAGRAAAATLPGIAWGATSAAVQEGRDLEISTAYVWKQPGSSMWFKRLVVSTEYACDYVELQNEANVPVTGVTLAAVATVSPNEPVKIYTTDVLPVDIPPGQTASIRPALLPFAEQMRLRSTTTHISITCALAEIRYANGASWKLTPNPAAHDVDAALSLPPADVPRSVLSDSTPPTPGYVCADDRGGEYSIGAIVPIRNEPGTFAECIAVTGEAGEAATRWVDHRLRH
jgi:beta-lactamase regulating signal transducer with metallopeptidase domain